MTVVLRRAHPADDLAGGDPRASRSCSPAPRAPLIRDAVGGRAGYRVMGRGDGAAIIAVGVVGAYRGTRGAPLGAVEPGAGTLRDQLRIVAGARDFRLLLTTFVLQALATGCMLAGVDYLASDVLGRKGAATILFVCFVGPALRADPGLGRASAPGSARSRATWPPRWSSPPAPLLAAARAEARRSAWSSPRPRWSGSGTPAARSSRWRCCPTPPPSTPGAPARTGPASTPASGPPARRSAWRSAPGCSRSCLALGGYRSSTDRVDVAQPDSALTAIMLGFSVLPAAAGPGQPVLAGPLLPRRRRRRR